MRVEQRVDWWIVRIGLVTGAGMLLCSCFNWWLIPCGLISIAGALLQWFTCPGCERRTQVLIGERIYQCSRCGAHCTIDWK
jgi:hypothetical protein